MRRLRSRAFKVGLVLGMVGVALAIKAPQFVSSALNQASNTIVVGGSPSLASRAAKLLAKDFEIEGLTDRTAPPTLAFLDAHRKAGALVVVTQERHQLVVTVYARDLSFVSASELRRDLMPLGFALATSTPETTVARYMNLPIALHGINSKFENSAAADAAHGIAYTLLIFLYVSILLNSQLIMTSVAEEKTSRIAELLIASVNPSALLAGKIGAAAVLAVIQLASWLAVGYVLSLGGGVAKGFAAMLVQAITPLDLAAFIAYFLLGYLQLSTLFAAAASLINRTEDLGSVSGPLVMPVVLAFFLALYALGFPSSTLATVTSFIPIVAPFTMFARIAVSVVPAWQIVISLLINIAAVWAFAILGGKIYRVGMLLYGRPPKLRQILATLRG